MVGLHCGPSTHEYLLDLCRNPQIVYIDGKESKGGKVRQQQQGVHESLYMVDSLHRHTGLHVKRQCQSFF